MSNQLTLPEPLVDSLIPTWTGLELWHSSLSTGPFTLLATIPYVAHQTVYTYLDLAGIQTDWYKTRRYGPGPTNDAFSTAWTVVSGLGPSAQQLIRGLGTRLREFVLSMPQSGTQTTLVDTALRQYFPVDVGINQFNGWVTPVDPTDLNFGIEKRGSSWAQGSATLTIYAPGWANNVTAKVHEIHMRFPRALILEAINDGVGQLGLSWYRETMDSSIVTAANQWRYIAPATQNWTSIRKIEIQINTDATAVAGGYPYVSADFLNPRIERRVDTRGIETWEIQFGMQPPAGRILRLYGEAYYTDLALDTDTVALAGEWARPAMSWIYSWGVFQLQDWTSNVVPTDQTEKVRQKAMDMLERQKNAILATAPPHKPGKIVTPGRGDGYPRAAPSDWRYLGANKSMH